MRRLPFPLIALYFSAAVICFSHSTRNQQTLRDQLRNMYRVSKFNVGMTELAERGSVLIIQKAGLTATPPSALPFVNYIRSGQVKHGKVSDFFARMSNDSTAPAGIQVGDGFYLVKLLVKKDELVFQIRGCGACEPGAPLDPNGLSAVVAFQFDKGYVASATAQQVHTVVAQFIMSAEEAQPGPPAVDTAQNPAAPPIAAPVTITGGEDIQQVIQVLGEPQTRATMGSKQILTYPGVKITFVNGKVSDVQ
jgi:hypothetical protein